MYNNNIYAYKTYEIYILNIHIDFIIIIIIISICY